MADNVVATHGGSGEGTTASFSYCGVLAEPDTDFIRVWLNRYDSLTADYADIVVNAWCDDGDPAFQFTWTATPGGAHITHYGDHSDVGTGVLAMPNEFYDSDYYDFKIEGDGIVLHYCVWVYVNGAPIPPPMEGGCVWGDWAGDGEEWWKGDGTSIAPGIIDPPDGASFRYSGGSDGTNQYLLSLDDTYPNQFWVSKFDGQFTARLDRWEVTGWTGSPVGVSDKFWDAFSDNQQLCADASRVVVIVYAEDRPGAFYEEVAFEVTVFDLAGAILHQWSIADTRRISGFSGSCIGGDYSVFFGIYDDDTSDESVAKIDLFTGALTDLFLIADVDAAIIAIDGTWGGLSYTCGIVEVEGDLIINGAAGIARVQQDGTPVWWQPIVDSGAEYRGLAHSGRGSVWACDYNAHADEYQYDGTYVQTITLPEPASQAWLGPCAGGSRGGWTFGIRF